MSDEKVYEWRGVEYDGGGEIDYIYRERIDQIAPFPEEVVEYNNYDDVLVYSYTNCNHFLVLIKVAL